MNTKSAIEKMFDSNPLVKFSVYTDIQSKVVMKLGIEIVGAINCGIKSDSERSSEIKLDINQEYGKFWLWTLGAYEVVRTMCQAKQCFVQDLANSLEGMKQKLGIIRMPFAKQELRGRKGPVASEPSIAGFNNNPPDLLFEIEGKVISVKQLVEDFANLFESIRREHVLADLRSAYPGGKTKGEMENEQKL